VLDSPHLVYESFQSIHYLLIYRINVGSTSKILHCQLKFFLFGRLMPANPKLAGRQKLILPSILQIFKTASFISACSKRTFRSWGYDLMPFLA